MTAAPGLPVTLEGEEHVTTGRGSLLLVAVVLAACSIVYELLAAETLSLLAANTVVWYSLVVGFYLAAMGIGAWWSRRIGRDTPWRSLFRIELGLTATGLAVAPILHLAHAAYSHLVRTSTTTAAYTVFYGTALVVVMTIGILTGIEMPLLMRIARRDDDRPETENAVLAFDYFGSLLGAVMFPVLLLPSLSLMGIGTSVAVVNLSIAAWILVEPLRGNRPRAAWPMTAVLGAAIAAMVLGAVRIEDYMLRRFFYSHTLEPTWTGRFEPRPDLPRVLRARSPYQRIDIVKDIDLDFMASLMPAYSRKLKRDPDYPVDHVLFLNGDFQTNTRYDEIYHEWFAHVPVVARGRVPENVLLLGGGDGLLLREILKYDGVKTVTHVDIDPTLVRIAKDYGPLRGANGDSFRDPRVTTHQADGFQWVRGREHHYDAVYIDFPVARNYDLSKLYSREFFHFVLESLEPGGYAVFDATGISYLTERDDEGHRWPTATNDWPIYYNTCRAAGFGGILPYLTTLEIDNPVARRTLEKGRLPARYRNYLRAIDDKEKREDERERITGALADQLMRTHSIQLEQGFIMLTRDPLQRATWDDPDVTLDVLNRSRYEEAFIVEYPRSEEVDENLVNSIVRPTLPSSPWWRPRDAY